MQRTSREDGHRELRSLTQTRALLQAEVDKADAAKSQIEAADALLDDLVKDLRECGADAARGRAALEKLRKRERLESIALSVSWSVLGVVVVHIVAARLFGLTVVPFLN